MKRKFLILILVILVVLSGCNEQKINTLESNTWQAIVNKEWSNFDVWAGSGIYFYEEDDIAYCTFMIYGSGVRVAGHHTSLVLVKNEGRIEIQLPKNVATGYLSDEDSNNEKLIEVELNVEDNKISLGNYQFEVYEGIENYEYIK